MGLHWHVGKPLKFKLVKSQLVSFDMGMLWKSQLVNYGSTFINTDYPDTLIGLPNAKITNSHC